MLDDQNQKKIELPTLEMAAKLIKFGEKIFGY